jgi:hypothetical protein
MRQVIVKVSPGAKTVSSGMVWETHCARLLAAAPRVAGVSETLGLGEGVNSSVRVGVGARGMVTVGLGIGVCEGWLACVCETWASTVAATSVRKGERSKVGVLAGVEGAQAFSMRRPRKTPRAVYAFFRLGMSAFLWQRGLSVCHVA